MKALSIHPVPAMQIFCKAKTIECRTWETNYRGEILICSTNRIVKNTIPGCALCTVKLVDVVPLKKEHMAAAGFGPKEKVPDDTFAWILDDLRIIRPFKIKGRLSLWNYDGDVEYLPDEYADSDDYFYIWEEFFV